jgi:hypothetical protein
MAIWKKNNLRLLKEEQELSDSSIFDEGLWQKLVSNDNQDSPKPKPPMPEIEDVEIRKSRSRQPSTPTTTTTRGRRVAIGGASSTT